MVKVAEKNAAAKSSHELAGDRLMELAQQKVPIPDQKLLPEKTSPQDEKKSHAGLLHALGRLKPMLPVLASGLRMVDHGAVQAVAQLLNFVDGGAGGQSAAKEELHQGLAEIDAGHRELRLRVQDQTVEMKRIEEQITLLRQTSERNETEHTELVNHVKSLNSLVRTIGAGLAILLILLITLVGLLLARHS